MIQLHLWSRIRWWSTRNSRLVDAMSSVTLDQHSFQIFSLTHFYCFYFFRLSELFSGKFSLSMKRHYQSFPCVLPWIKIAGCIARFLVRVKIICIVKLCGGPLSMSEIFYFIFFFVSPLSSCRCSINFVPHAIRPSWILSPPVRRLTRKICLFEWPLPTGVNNSVQYSCFFVWFVYGLYRACSLKYYTKVPCSRLDFFFIWFTTAKSSYQGPLLCKTNLKLFRIDEMDRWDLCRNIWRSILYLQEKISVILLNYLII